MATGVQLSVLVKNVRAECGHALSTTQGLNQVETLKYLVSRTQEELWTAFVWPELRYRAESPLQSGQYVYQYPTTMPFDSIREAWGTIATGDAFNWTPVTYGIPENLIVPGGTNSERSDPVQFWDVESATSYRVWPTPNTTTTLRFVGQKPLTPLIADADTCVIDSTAIVLLTAADLLARAKAEDADIKMQKAQRHIAKLLGNKINAKNKVSTLGGGVPDRRGVNGSITFGRGF